MRSRRVVRRWQDTWPPWHPDRADGRLDGPWPEFASRASRHMKRVCYSRYALQVLFHLAMARDHLCKIGDVAAALHIPVSNLSKLVADMAGAGYIRTIRGRGGGITLGPDAGAIRIGDIIRHIEGEEANPFEEGAIRVDGDNAQLEGVFSEAIAAYFRVLDGWSVADLLAEGPRSNRHAPADRDQPSCWRVRNWDN